MRQFMSNSVSQVRQTIFGMTGNIKLLSDEKRIKIDSFSVNFQITYLIIIKISFSVSIMAITKASKFNDRATIKADNQKSNLILLEPLGKPHW